MHPDPICRAPRTPNPAGKPWWRGQVLACVDPMDLADGGGVQGIAVGAEPALSTWPQLQALGVGGMWCGEPGPSDTVLRVHPHSGRVLSATPLAANAVAAQERANDLLWLVQSHTWFAREPMAPRLHAVLSCLYKQRSSQWPCWLVAAQGLHGSTALEHWQHLLAAIQLSLRGTSLLPQAIARDPAGLLPGCARFIAWRNALPPLVQGKIRLLPVHDNVLMYVREAGGQQVLCAFNLSARYVRVRLPPALASAHLLPGSGMRGARLVDQHLDCDPWSALFAAVAC